LPNKKTIPIETYSTIKVLDPDFAKQLDNYRIRIGAIKSGYPVLTDWHPVIPEGWGDFPKVPFQRSIVYKGNAQTWAYSHHQAITKFGDRYVASWSNGFLHEDYIGQEVHLAWSADGIWTTNRLVSPTPCPTPVQYQCTTEPYLQGFPE